ncbi:uncharacterized protein LOC126578058 [Anopheles aquasalis]|uniref:uncharacterized protein LOC126578058 n=1 Tax=Anopheles aquasalis TaxID=42839 RepID=UPI00215A26AC|nr:uncharacterized protein LOC126578058 [Anopheles aquasalis]
MGSFEQKKNLLFTSLESAEQSIGTDSVLHQNVSEIDYSLDRKGCRPGKLINVDRYRNRESIFKRPAAPIGHCLKRSTVPDFQRNPQKWTKYTLEDVDTSERTNTAAAFSFLRQIEEQRETSLALQNALEAGDVQDSQEDTQPPKHGFCKSVVRFNRSVRLRGQLEEADEPPEPATEDRPQMNGRRVLMPEYVVGQKVPKRSKRILGGSSTATSKANPSTQMQLDHLMEENEEDDEDEEAEDCNGVD